MGYLTSLLLPLRGEEEGPVLRNGSEGLGGLKSETEAMNRARQHLLFAN